MHRTMPDELKAPEPVPLAIERVAAHLACWPMVPRVPVTRWNGVRRVHALPMRSEPEPDELARPVPSWGELVMRQACPCYLGKACIAGPLVA